MSVDKVNILKFQDGGFVERYCCWKGHFWTGEHCWCLDLCDLWVAVGKWCAINLTVLSYDVQSSPSALFRLGHSAPRILSKNPFPWPARHQNAFPHTKNLPGSISGSVVLPSWTRTATLAPKSWRYLLSGHLVVHLYLSVILQTNPPRDQIILHNHMRDGEIGGGRRGDGNRRWGGWEGEWKLELMWLYKSRLSVEIRKHKRINEWVRKNNTNHHTYSYHDNYLVARVKTVLIFVLLDPWKGSAFTLQCSVDRDDLCF